MGSEVQEKMKEQTINTADLVPADLVKGEDDEETAQLIEMLQHARAYISGFDWCPPIAQVWLGLGVGGVIGVFLVKFKKPIANSDDDMLWIVCGDVPCAYLVTDNAKDAVSALDIYCDMMNEWIDAVENGDSLEDVFPVNAPADLEHSDLLRKRVTFIRTRIIPEFEK